MKPLVGVRDAGFQELSLPAGAGGGLAGGFLDVGLLLV
jgi:hypothetical protein